MSSLRLWMAVMATAGLLAGMTTTAAAADYESVIDLTFPVAGPNQYWDSYHDGRSGGRVHRATDIMADHGAPVHAAMGGVVRWMSSPDTSGCGYCVFVQGDDGRQYEYVHLGPKEAGREDEAYVSGLERGVRVDRGQLLGWVGCSGNASCSGPHLHFGIEDPDVKDPYGTNLLNPYNSLRAAELEGDLPGALLSAVGDPPRDSLPQGAIPVSGRWTGGRELAGWFVDGVWSLRLPDGRTVRVPYGTSGDVPVVGDWNGDGVDSMGIVRNGRWHLRNGVIKGAADHVFTYGRVTQGDVPLVGDWDGDGGDTIGIVRNGRWHLRNALKGGVADISFTYGRVVQGDVPLIGDWDDDGDDTMGIVRNGRWHLRNTLKGGASDVQFTYGRVLDGDIPLTGTWDGRGGDSPAIVRGDAWHLRNELGGGIADVSFHFTG